MAASAIVTEISEPNSWTCTRCTLVNDENASQCSACENRPPWTCHSCCYKNSGHIKRCEICDAQKLGSPGPLTQIRNAIIPRPNSGAQSAKVLSREHWACRLCTLENQESRKVCAACHTPRYSSDSNAFHPISSPSPSRSSGNSTSTAGDVSFMSSIASRHETQFLETLRHIQEDIARDQYQKIVEYCKSSKEKFVDDSFPPCPKSLGGDIREAQRRVSGWRRPGTGNHAVYPPDSPKNPYVIFRGTPMASDILQGLLGNCWFLSALAVVCERPEMVQRLFLTQNINKEGVYQLRLCIDGEWTIVTVDDLFPCDAHGQLAYSRAARKQLWVALIEKALAKSRGSYAALISGRCIEGLATLTGEPCETIPLQKHPRNTVSSCEWDVSNACAIPPQTPDGDTLQSDSYRIAELWAKLLSAREAKYLMGASCGAGYMDADEQAYRRMGLESRHAYSVLDVRDVLGGIQLVRLRNPWGHFSWLGAWSDGWDGWTPELKAELGPHGAHEGVFWMSFPDFCQYFDSVDVCKTREGWCESRMAVEFRPNCEKSRMKIARLLVMQNTEVDLTLYQKHSRRERFDKHGELDLCLVLSQERENAKFGTLCKDSGRSIKPFKNCDVHLKPGSYLAIGLAFNHWGIDLREFEIPTGVLAVHSSHRIIVEELDVHVTCLADALIQLVLAQGKSQPARPELGLYYMTKGWAGLILVVENWSEEACMQVQCDCTESTNLVSTRGSLQTVDSIPPMHRQVVMLLTQLESSESYYVSHRLMHRVCPHQNLGDWAPNGEGNTAHLPPIDERVYGLHAPRPIELS